MKNIQNIFLAIIGGLFVLLIPVYFIFPTEAHNIISELVKHVQPQGKDTTIDNDSIIGNDSILIPDTITLITPKKEELVIVSYNKKRVAYLCDSLSCRTVGFTPRDGYVSLMNIIADEMQTPVVYDSNIDSLKKAGYLVRITENVNIKSTEEDPFDMSNAYLAQPAADALDTLACHFKKKFNQKLFLTSALRTVEYQKKLTKKNRNATEEGSMHMRGCAFDITYKKLSREKIKWIEAELKKLKTARIWITKETRGSLCFHIVVFSENNKKAK